MRKRRIDVVSSVVYTNQKQRERETLKYHHTVYVSQPSQHHTKPAKLTKHLPPPPFPGSLFRLTFRCHPIPQSYYIAVQIAHFPLTFVEGTFLSVITYFMAGLSLADGAANFFYFYAMMLALCLYGLSLARVMAYSMPSTEVGQGVVPGIVGFVFFLLLFMWIPLLKTPLPDPT